MSNELKTEEHFKHNNYKQTHHYAQYKHKIVSQLELGDIEIFMDDISLNKIPRYYLISQYLQL